MSEDNDSASGRQVISRAAAAARAGRRQQRPEPGPDREEDGPAAHHRAPHRRGAGSAAAGRHHARRRPPGPGAGAAGGLGAYRRVAAARPSSRRWGGGCAKPWTCACSGASTRCRSTSSPRTRNCAWSRRWAPPIRSTAPRMAAPAGAPGRRGAGGAAGRAAGTPHRQHHHRAQGSLAQLAEVRTRGWALTWRNTRSASAGSACISRRANPSSTRCRSRCRPRATKGSWTLPGGLVPVQGRD